MEWMATASLANKCVYKEKVKTFTKRSLKHLYRESKKFTRK
jgi:hypothetical protein